MTLPRFNWAVPALFATTSFALSSGAQTPLVNGGNHDGQIAVAGEVDAWSFTALAGEVVHVRTTQTSGGTTFAPRVRIRDTNGTLVGDASGAVSTSTSSARMLFVPASSGTFTVSVAATTPTATGGYRIFHLKLPGTPTVPVGDEGGELINGGRRDGTITVGDVDPWTFSAEIADVVDLRMVQLSGGTGFVPRFRVYDAAGALVGHAGGAESSSTSEARLAFVPPADGVYTLVADSSTAEGTGQYGLFYLKLPGTVTVPAGDDGDTLVSGGSRDGTITVGDLDPWVFSTVAGREVHLRAGQLTGGVAFSPRIRIYDATGELVGYAAGSSNSSASEARVTFTADLTGNYSAVVDSDLIEGTGTYRIQYLELPSAPIVPAADEGGALSSGNNHDGTVTVGDLDAWSFDATSGDRVTFTLTQLTGGVAFSPRARVFDASGGQVGHACDPEAGASSTSTLRFIVGSTGTFRVIIDSALLSGSGNYRLGFSRESGPFSYPVPTGTLLTNGGNHEGSLATAGAEDRWRFTATAGERVFLRAALLTASNSTWFRPVIRLYDANGDLLASGNSGSHDNEVEVVAPNSGWYSVAIASHYPDYTGTYRLHFLKTTSEFVIPGGDEGGVLTNGGNHEGATTIGDIDTWTFAAVAGERVLLRAAHLTASHATWYRPVIRVYGPDGEHIVSGDSGYHDNEVEFVTGAAGTYSVVIASHYENYTGTYRLHFLKVPGGYIVPGGDEGGELTNGGNHEGATTNGDIDVWTLTAAAGERVLLRAAHLTASHATWYRPIIRVYGPDGEPVVSGNSGNHDNEVGFVAGVAGGYSVVITSHYVTYTGTYRLHVLKMPASFVVPGGDEGGALTNGGNHEGATTIGDLDGWTFAAAAGDRVVLRAAQVTASHATWYRPIIRVFGPDGEPVASGGSGSDDNEVEIVAATAGTHTVLISSHYLSYTGTYRLNFLKVPGTFIVSGGDEGGVLINGGNHEAAITLGDIDGWAFSGAIGDRVLLRAGRTSGHATWFLPMIRLYDSNGELVASAAGSSGDMHLEYTLVAAGAHTAVVSSHYIGYTGGYRLHYLKAPGSFVVPEADQGGPLTNGGTREGALTLGDLDAWTHTVAEGERLIVRAVSSSFLPQLRVYGPTGALVQEASGSARATIDAVAPITGTYTIVVAANVGGTGNYLLSFLSVPGNVLVPDGDEGGPLSNGGNHEGEMSAADFDVWTIDAAVGDSLFVLVTRLTGAGTFTPAARIIGPGGTAITNGTSNGTLVSLAARATTAGRHYVVVSDGGASTGVGTYRIQGLRIPGDYIVPAGDEGGALATGVATSGTLVVGDLDPWTFEASVGNNIGVTMSESTAASPIVPALALFAPDGEPKAVHFGAATAQINHTVTLEGMFTVVALDNNGTGTGGYSITVTGNVPPVPAPTISTQPLSQTPTAGGEVVLSVAATGEGTLTYQWERDGVAITGATGASYRIPSGQQFHSGSYAVVVTSSNGRSRRSAAATVAVQAPTPNNARLLNLSTRALSQTGDSILIPGFVLGGSGTKRLLIRAVGPTLGALGVGGTLADPEMRLVSGGVTLASNDDWGTNTNKADIISTAATVGAFDLVEGSKDAALLVDLGPGQYTVPTAGVAGGTGVAIVELYDADTGMPPTNLTNISNRGFVGVGENVMIPGIVVSNEGARTFLIRAVGPTLAGFGVEGTLADPVLTVFSGQTAILTNDDWSTVAGAAATASTAATVGAFPLSDGSKDAAFVVTLPPGPYTVQATGKDGSTGIALVEVYLVP